MKITITAKQAEKIGADKFEEWGFNRHSWQWQNSKAEIELRDLSDLSIARLEKVIEGYQGVYGIKSTLKDIEIWRSAINSKTDGNTLVKSLKVFDALLTTFMQTVPGQHVFKKHDIVTGTDDEDDVSRYHAYYVSNVTYHPPVHHKGTKHEPAWTEPPYVNCRVIYQTYEGEAHESASWWEGDCVGKTVAECLALRNYIPATEALHTAYQKRTKRFQKVLAAVGRQYVASGYALSLDSSKKNKQERWWDQTSSTMALPANSRVVIDVIDEESEENETTFASKKMRTVFEEVEEETTGVDAKTMPEIEIPVHHYLVVFHLAKHMRFQIHLSQLHRYKYDTKLIDKLVIDDMRKSLIKLLIEHRDSKYEDIIGNKSGGAIVMLCGSPGTGKTLTAEVFAESEQRALYSVQCAQLGTSPDELEDELRKVLKRASRWNAVLLLDEADVYVHRRGTDIQQNALVGVFLRVLEYMDAIMFMTTNRSEDIDDAVASRCTARLTYQNPSFDEQCRIWRVLIDTATAKMSDKTIAKVAKANPTLSGRDIKNLIKLAVLVSDSEFTVETIDFVKQFKPT